MTEHVRVEERNFAFQNRLQTFSIMNIDHIDTNSFFSDAFNYFETRIQAIVQTHYLIKIGTSFLAKFEKKVIGEEGERTESQEIFLNTTAEIVDFETNLRTFYDEYVVSALNKKVEEVELRGSGFTLAQIIELNIQVSSYDPYAGASYINLPKFLQDKKAIINVQNTDNECFKYAVLSALYPAKNHVDRVNNYLPYENLLNFTGITYPVDFKKIIKFEQQNPRISINVYMYCEKSKNVRHIRLTKQVKEKHIHLLLLTQQSSDDDNSMKSHYCWIKKFGALLCKWTKNILRSLLKSFHESKEIR